MQGRRYPYMTAGLPCRVRQAISLSGSRADIYGMICPYLTAGLTCRVR